jgi:hypothetical protein
MMGSQARGKKSSPNSGKTFINEARVSESSRSLNEGLWEHEQVVPEFGEDFYAFINEARVSESSRVLLLHHTDMCGEWCCGVVVLWCCGVVICCSVVV